MSLEGNPKNMSHSSNNRVTPVIAIHGGAGTIRMDLMTPDRDRDFREGLLNALNAGNSILQSGGSALDAVTASVVELEENPLFNAGRGAVYTAARTHEMDAAVMRGEDRRCGAVAGVCGPRNPIKAARAVMEKTRHVMLAGEGAMSFCHSAGLEMKEPQWFDTEPRLAALEETLASRARGDVDDKDEAKRHGTVGAVALDMHGHLAAGTSTGGMTAKMCGRVGDSPVIGAGTWADDRTCAISATGDGEFFIRCAVAHEVDARMRLCGQALQTAATDVIEEVGAFGGSGGLIAVDRTGAVSLPFNCSGMYRGWIGLDGIAHVAIFKE